MNTIAALIEAYGWREVVPIYEDTDYGRGNIPYLADSLQEFGASMPYRSAIPESANSDQVEKELYKLMTMQTTVYVVHMSSNIGSILFTKANELGMMSKGYACILADGIPNVVNSLSPSVLEHDNPNDPPSQLSILDSGIINVVGSRLKEIGFWTAKRGIFRELNENRSKATTMNSIPDLKQVMWPGEVYTVPKGWQIPTNGKKLWAGVWTSGYPELMKVETDPVTNEITASGYAIDVFEEVIK
ncbi:hypothetical protein GUJ93_ZPchr0009g1868 [Zizania palustris]|uniref:Receptor ligand binding region domain-containing protein n=1 Tax=Zizania palustris TaxID=103762 RepID=A0A8J5RJ27_ZIZPA|nr:hypothetical protein GUJ93_ZPchr0009g1868 [Zizania palustris]